MPKDKNKMKRDLRAKRLKAGLVELREWMTAEHRAELKRTLAALIKGVKTKEG